MQGIKSPKYHCIFVFYFPDDETILNNNNLPLLTANHSSSKQAFQRLSDPYPEGTDAPTGEE